MCSLATELLQVITEAIESLNKEKLLEIIHTTDDIKSLLQQIEVYHRLVAALWNSWGPADLAVPIIYLLSLHGAEINQQDENGDIALLAYLRDEENICDEVLTAFLRCGSDLTLKNKHGEDVLNLILDAQEIPRYQRAKVLEYMPGIWMAVESDDAMTVRRLINQWCSIRVIKKELTVLQLAFEKGTENIIRVVSGIGPSMDLAHAVIAGDIHHVKLILQSKANYNINLKNMSDGGASPLFYAMCQNDQEMVHLLLQHGAKLDLPMEGEDGSELPLVFAALSQQAGIDPELLQSVLPLSPIILENLYYQGRNILFYCVDNSIDLDLFETILRRCSAHVLTQRIQENLDAREYAEQCDKLEYVRKIDEVVQDWCTDEEDPSRRTTLALQGYNLNLVHATPTPQNMSEELLNFLQIIPKYEESKTRLFEAVEEDNLVTVKQILYEDTWSHIGLEACLADSRQVGDGQPLLHKAVLRRHMDIVREIALCLYHRCRRKLDSIRDQYYRTALHYVYGMEDSKEMIMMLEDLGMSEYVMDKDGRPPLAFKDRRGQKEMRQLLQYHRIQDFSNQEPDPWTVKLPLPIVGYMTKCVHDHHERKKSLNQSKAQYDSLQGSKVTHPGNSSYQSAGPDLLEKEKYSYDNNAYMKSMHSVLNSPDLHVHRSMRFEDNREHFNGIQAEVLHRYGDKLLGQYSVAPDLSEFQLSRSKSAETLDSMSHSLRDDNSQSVSREDDSNSESDIGELEEDYDGDYSDNEESDDETNRTDQAGYCVLL